MSIEAMKQALEALETCHWDYDSEEESYKTFDEDLVNNAVEALRQAIEQAEYGKLTVKFGERAKEYLEGAKKKWDTSDMAYRPNGLTIDDDTQEYKRPWIGLTDEEIHKIIDDCTPNEAEFEELNDFAKAIFAVEAKLKERNT